jgi:hypothetical protein
MAAVLISKFRQCLDTRIHTDTLARSIHYAYVQHKKKMHAKVRIASHCIRNESSDPYVPSQESSRYPPASQEPAHGDPNKAVADTTRAGGSSRIRYSTRSAANTATA